MLTGQSAGISFAEKSDLREAGETLDSDQTFSFVIIGHLYRTIFCGDPDNINKLIAEIRKLKPYPDAVIFTGDIIVGVFMGAGIPEMGLIEDSLESQWDYVFSHFEKLKIPIWIAPGNHDITSVNAKRAKIVENVYKRRVADPIYGVKTLGGAKFIFLNSAFEHYHPYIDEPQRQWLLSELDSESQKPTFLITHLPMWYSRIRGAPGHTTNTDFNWMKIIHPHLRDKVDFVFSGDAGIFRRYFFYEVIDGISYHISGASKEGIVFLHVVVRNNKVKVYPHFMDIQSYKPCRITRSEVEVLKGKPKSKGISS